MTDPRALTRVVDGLLWTLRRGGLRIATSQAIDVVRAVEAVGLADPRAVRESVAAVVVDRRTQRARFDAMFDAYFAPEAQGLTSLWERLAAKGFSDTELEALKDLLERLAHDKGDGAAPLEALLERGVELDRLLHLAGVARALDAVQNPLQIGFYTYRLL